MANLRSAQYAGPDSRIDINSYISGYFDGEGCFCVAIAPRPTLKVGWEVRPSVSVSQNSDRGEVIELVKDHFGCGTVRPDPSDHTHKWETRSLRSIAERVLPHFLAYPLLSGKQADVMLLDRVCQLMLARAHLTMGGLVSIAELAEQMNPSGIRRYGLAAIQASVR